jgi:D-xylose 1-dehydrogenase (NADP+, D-xylono-1,5-lactone-forming)
MTQTRWAVLGTANIAAKSFLPAMRAAGGRAVVVGSRDQARGAQWAERNEVARTADYAGAIDSDDVDAVYIALPNHEHTTWTARAVAAGRAVLCEKPLGIDTADTEQLLSSVGADALLWESFVFPFHPQTQVIKEQLPRLGRIREIVSEFTFTAPNPESNIRWQAALGGGALRDVGCYCVRLARLLYEAEPADVAARAFVEHGVDADIAAILDFPDERRLVLSASLRGAPSTYTRVVGDSGELRISNPFHPRAHDTVSLWTDGAQARQWSPDPRTAFQCAVEHIHAVLRGDDSPRHLATTDSLGNARALDMILAAAG